MFAYELASTRDLLEVFSKNRKLTIGETAPTLYARNESGDEVAVNLVAQQVPTILYLYSSTCYWCEQNSLNVHELISQSQGKFGVVLLSVESPSSLTKGILRSEATRLFSPSIESKIIFDLNATPMTILFSHDGVLEKLWKGAYTDEKRIEIENALGIRLPGLKG